MMGVTGRECVWYLKQERHLVRADLIGVKEWAMDSEVPSGSVLLW